MLYADRIHATPTTKYARKCKKTQIETESNFEY